MTLLDFAVVQHLAEDGGNDLPGHPIFVFEPTASLFFLRLGELLPQLIDFSCVSQFTRRA
jgi:hypothetical protein